MVDASRSDNGPQRALVGGTLCVLLAGAAWALFAARLFADGQAPSRVLLPIDRESYYRVQSLFIVPALLLLWGLMGVVAFRLTGGSRRGSFWSLLGPLGVAYGLPLLSCFVVPEWIVYERWGIEGLRVAFRYTMPIAGIVTWLGATSVVRTRRNVSWRRAAAVAAVALVVQAAIGSPFLR